MQYASSNLWTKSQCSISFKKNTALLSKVYPGIAEYSRLCQIDGSKLHASMRHSFGIESTSEWYIVQRSSSQSCPVMTTSRSELKLWLSQAAIQCHVFINLSRSSKTLEPSMKASITDQNEAKLILFSPDRCLCFNNSWQFIKLDVLSTMSVAVINILALTLNFWCYKISTHSRKFSIYIPYDSFLQEPLKGYKHLWVFFMQIGWVNWFWTHVSQFLSIQTSFSNFFNAAAEELWSKHNLSWSCVRQQFAWQVSTSETITK